MANPSSSSHHLAPSSHLTFFTYLSRGESALLTPGVSIFELDSRKKEGTSELTHHVSCKSLRLFGVFSEKESTLHLRKRSTSCVSAFLGRLVVRRLLEHFA